MEISWIKVMPQATASPCFTIIMRGENSRVALYFDKKKKSLLSSFISHNDPDSVHFFGVN